MRAPARPPRLVRDRSHRRIDDRRARELGRSRRAPVSRAASARSPGARPKGRWPRRCTPCWSTPAAGTGSPERSGWRSVPGSQLGGPVAACRGRRDGLRGQPSRRGSGSGPGAGIEAAVDPAARQPDAAGGSPPWAVAAILTCCGSAKSREIASGRSTLADRRAAAGADASGRSPGRRSRQVSRKCRRRAAAVAALTCGSAGLRRVVLTGSSLGRISAVAGTRAVHDAGLVNVLAPLPNAVIGRRAADAEVLADGVRRVEPHKPEQPVGRDAGEHVGDLGGLARGGRRAGLGDEDRVAGQLRARWRWSARTTGRTASSASGSSRRSRPRSRTSRRATTGRAAGSCPCWRVVDDVDRPQPGHVPGAQRAEQGDDVPPGGHERRRRCVLCNPRGTSCRSSRGRSPG